jgi:hypothetical protein
LALLLGGLARDLVGLVGDLLREFEEPRCRDRLLALEPLGRLQVIDRVEEAVGGARTVRF